MYQKIITSCLIFILGINILSSQTSNDCERGDCFNNFSVSKLSNGNKYYGFYKNGKKHGVGIVANDDGSSRWFSSYLNGEKEGTEVSMHYEYRKLDKIIFRFYENGQIIYPIIRIKPQKQNKESFTAKFYPNDYYHQVSEAKSKSAFIKGSGSKKVQIDEHSYGGEYVFYAFNNDNNIYVCFSLNNYDNFIELTKSSYSKNNIHGFSISKNGNIESYNKETGDRIFLISGSGFPFVKDSKSYFYNAKTKQDFKTFFNNNDNLFREGVHKEFHSNGQLSEMGKTAKEFHPILKELIDKLNSMSQQERVYFLRSHLYRDALLSQANSGGVVRDGLWKYYRNDGSLKAEVEYDKGLFINGKSYFEHVLKINRLTEFEKGLSKFVTDYFEDGSIKKAVTYNIVNGKNVFSGDYKEYYSNTNLKTNGKYIGGKKEGLWKAYYENGNIKEEQEYNQDICKGVYKRWSEDGILEEDSKCNGDGSVKRTYFYSSGNIKSSGTDKYSGREKKYLRQGLWTFNFENGQKQKAEIYENGIHKGYWEQFLLDGTQILKDGNGEYRIYKNGTLTMRSEHRNGSRKGITTWYYHNGQVKQSALYKYDKKSKPFGLRWEILECYDELGNALDCGTLKEGNGTWNSYDKNGNLEKVTTYQNGRKVE